MTGLPGWAFLAGLTARIRSLHRGLRRRDEVEQEMREEFQHHLAMLTEDLIRQGLPPDEAARRARVEFGHMDTHRDHARESRGLHRFDQVSFSWIDVKLGLRMLVKHPLLSLAAVFALAVGIPVGLAPTHVASAVTAPLPGDEEDRVRALRYWDPGTVGVATTGIEDFDFWSHQLRSFSELAAFRTSFFNVAPEGGLPAPVSGAQLSPSIFRMLRTGIHLGRSLNEGEGEPGAPEVVVIGHDLWTSRFGADSGIIGRTLSVGHVLHTVVGVMPSGFRFPANEQIWLPLRPLSVSGIEPGLRVRIIGRLADGVSADQAHAELSAVGHPPLDGLPLERRQLQPEVVPFGLLYLGLPRGGVGDLPEYRFVQLLAILLLTVAAGNVAMLVYARTATRHREIAIRTELGASRARIVSQIFVETLVLAILAAGVGVLSIDWVLRHVNLAALAGEAALPYWLTLGLTGDSAMRALALAAVSATIAGVVPAIRITGHGVHQRLQGSSRVRFGGMTTVLIVADIAVSVAAVGFAMSIANRATDLHYADQAAGIPASEYLAVEFRRPEGGLASPGGANGQVVTDALAVTQRALVAALEMEPGVGSIAIADALPRMEHPSRPIEIEGIEVPPGSPLRWVRTARVDVNFFGALGQRVVAGRDFEPADGEGDRAVAIVNTAFVNRMLEGHDPLGRRVRLRTSTETGQAEWSEIIGVVRHLGVNMVASENGAAVYLPAGPGRINPMRVGIHVLGGTPEQLVPRVREIAARIDPDLVMGEVATLSDLHQGDWYILLAMATGLALLVGVLVALAVSGLYAMLSLSVTERTREIGIRAALGASQPTLVLTILRRSLLQITVGGLIGLPLAARFIFELAGGATSGRSPLVSLLIASALAAGIVLLVGILSCLVPTRRVLAIEASEAMRAEV